MALELLGGPFTCAPLIQRPDPLGHTDHPGGYTMLLEGRGVLVSGSGMRRYLVQPDGSFARIGPPRFGYINHLVILAGVEGRRTYAELSRVAGTGGVLELHPVTLMGWRQIATSPPMRSGLIALLPGGGWMWVASNGIAHYNPERGGFFLDVPLSVSYASGFMSWADNPDEVWIGNGQGFLIRYNFVTRKLVGGVLKTGVSSMGLFYWRQHKVFVSLHYSTEATSTRVWATTPKPEKIVQTVLPAPRAGRVSRVSSRLLGSFDEPCAGEAIHWSAPAGYQVVPVQPVTDAGGYALADLIVPMGATGSADVTASVVL